MRNRRKQDVPGAQLLQSGIPFLDLGFEFLLIRCFAGRDFLPVMTCQNSKHTFTIYLINRAGNDLYQRFTSSRAAMGFAPQNGVNPATIGWKSRRICYCSTSLTAADTGNPWLPRRIKFSSYSPVGDGGFS